jgi:hypothetical protein
MRIAYIFVLLTLLLGLSCNSKKDKNLEVLSKEKMVDIICDLKVVDAAHQAGYNTLLRLKQKDSVGIEEDTSILLEEYVSVQDTLATNTIDVKNLAIDTSSMNKASAIEKVTRISKIQQQSKKIKLKANESHIGADYNFIFLKHGVSRKEFETSLDFYSKNPEELIYISEKAMEKLSIMEIEVQKSFKK